MNELRYTLRTLQTHTFEKHFIDCHYQIDNPRYRPSFKTATPRKVRYILLGSRNLLHKLLLHLKYLCVMFTTHDEQSDFEHANRRAFFVPESVNYFK